MRYLKPFFGFLVCFLVQTNLLNLVSINGYTPNLMLAAVIAVGFLYPQEGYAIVFGTIFGLLYDISCQNIAGPTAIAFLFVGLLCYVISHVVTIENVLNFWLTDALGIVLYNLVFYGLTWISGNPKNFLYAFNGMKWPAVYTFCVSTVIYFILLRIIIKRVKESSFFKKKLFM